MCGVCVHLGVEFHVGLLLVVVPELLGSLRFLRQVGLLPLFYQLWMIFPAGQLTLAMLNANSTHRTLHTREINNLWLNVRVGKQETAVGVELT